MRGRLIVAGLGYSGTAIAAAARAAGFAVAGTARDPAGSSPPAGVEVLAFEAAGAALAAATHVAITTPPGDGGDPVLLRHGDALRGNQDLRWLGYLSTTGVYGDRGGAVVEEHAHVTPGSDRARRRVAAELAWADFADRAAVDLFRTGGIYGPGRSVLDELAAGTARRILKPGHAFSRIHRDDIAQAVVAAALRPPPPGVRVLHLVDDTPAESAAVVEEAARLLGIPPPPAIGFAEAFPAMSPMARSFWAENRQVSSRGTRAALGIAWRYPSYREGLRACLAEHRRDQAGEQAEVGRP